MSQGLHGLQAIGGMGERVNEKYVQQFATLFQKIIVNENVLIIIVNQCFNFFNFIIIYR